MNWSVGDRAIFVSVEGDALHKELYGEECYLMQLMGPMGICPCAWRVRFSSVEMCVAQVCLRPIEEKYDGMELTTWSECPFKPQELVT
ncbi:hypothetical protein LCGC14_1624000 [marine sediment metagenome]|uniref:Uncharacterized protein n=1 Tax=marine sediment metagenome TaxID=412755 RepID=A0A0F9I4L4_9ZZZZ